MTILHIDFETFSACDLKAEGLARYAADPTTGVHCMAFAFDDEPVGLVTSASANGEAHVLGGQEGMYDVINHVRDGGLVYAHNSAFELAIWNQIMVPRYGWPPLSPEQCRCTLAMAYAMSLPGSLEAAAPAVGISQRKDAIGKRIMLKWCKPKPDGTFWVPGDDHAQFKALCDYCKTDVEVERALHHRLMDLSTAEHEVWVLDYRINQRGILVDLPAIDQAIRLVESEKARLNQRMLRVTSGVVGSCTEVQLLVKWIKSQGVTMPGVAKADVLDALDGDLPPLVREALELRKEAAKSSTAKLAAMRDRANKDGRVRGIHQYHGAGTGRWAGRGVQVQNLSRPRKDISPENIQDMIDLFDNPRKLDMLYGPTMDALSDCLRGMVVAPPGKDLIAADFSAVEARVLAWLAGEEDVLDVFRRGEDLYKVTGARIYHKSAQDVTKDERQIAKVAVLALGFGGGQGAFQSMAKNYGMKVPEAEAEVIKLAWRAANPKIVAYWYALENAAIQAVQSGQTTTVGQPGRQVSFRKKGSFLWCKLPSGRVLCYPYPEIREVETPWGELKDALTYMTVVSNIKAKILDDPASSGTWKRISTYGGSVAENLTQATARDLLAEAMVRLDSAGCHIVMHVHDEAVIEVDETAGEATLKKVCALMAELPLWAKGLPLAAEGWRGKRYRK